MTTSATSSDSPEATIVAPESVAHENGEGGVSLTVGPAKEFWLIPIPARLRYDSSKPFHFTIVMNMVFGITSTFVVANLYYCQPILIDLSKEFNVSYEEVSNIPTLVQAGYALGLLLISPMGDLVRRRQLILLLIFTSATLSIGVALSTGPVMFEVFSFFVGIATVTPQILLPLAADLAPPERRATAISVTLSGLLFGVLIARVLSGIIAEFASWRDVYYMAIGLQFMILFMTYFVIPDYPAKNLGLSYLGILGTMIKFAVTEPVLIQAYLINLASSACFSNFWVTLTFLLGAPPYNYSTLVIGLFGLVGMFGVAMGPLVGRTIDRLIPWYASLIGIIMLSIFQAIQVAAGGINIGAVIITTLGLDIFRQMLQVSLTTNVFSIAPEARARLNAILILMLFVGQVMGTSVGTRVFVNFGWRAGAALGLGWYGYQLCMLLIRGPHVDRYTWFGYQGGLEWRKSVVDARKRGIASGTEEKKNDPEQGHATRGDTPLSDEKDTIQLS